jgi:hypothetical protein
VQTLSNSTIAGVGRLVDVGDLTIARQHFLGGASTPPAIGFAPNAIDAVTGDGVERVWGITAGIGAASLFWIGVSHPTCRMEPMASLFRSSTTASRRTGLRHSIVLPWIAPLLPAALL